MTRTSNLLKTALCINLLLPLGACNSGPDQQQEGEIRASLAGYVTAVNARDGNYAAQFVSDSTFAAFGECGQLALEADSDTLRARSVFEQMIVLTLRAVVDVSGLGEMSGRDVFVLAIERGALGDGSGDVSVGDLSMTGENSAEGAAVIDGQEAPINFSFVFENEGWAWDMTTMFPLFEGIMEEIASQAGTSVEEQLLILVGTVAGAPVNEDIWNVPDSSPPTPVPPSTTPVEDDSATPPLVPAPVLDPPMPIPPAPAADPSEPGEPDSAAVEDDGAAVTP